MRDMSSVKDSVLKIFSSIQKGTEFVLQVVPMDKLDHKVYEKGASIGEIAFHIASMPAGAVVIAKGIFTEFPSNEVLLKTLEDALGECVPNKDFPTMFKKGCEMFLDHYASKTDEQWITETYSTFLSRGPITYLEGFLGTQNHIVQHRGTLVGYLRVMGIPVGLAQYWGFKPLEQKEN